MIIRTASVVACDDHGFGDFRITMLDREVIEGFSPITFENKTIHECAQLCAIEFVRSHIDALAKRISGSYVDVTVKVTGDVPESRNVVRVSLKTEVINPRDGAE